MVDMISASVWAKASPTAARSKQPRALGEERRLFDWTVHGGLRSSWSEHSLRTGLVITSHLSVASIVIFESESDSICMHDREITLKSDYSTGRRSVFTVGTSSWPSSAPHVYSHWCRLKLLANTSEKNGASRLRPNTDVSFPFNRLPYSPVSLKNSRIFSRDPSLLSRSVTMGFRLDCLSSRCSSYRLHLSTSTV
jgi:hypothetical protein